MLPAAIFTDPCTLWPPHDIEREVTGDSKKGIIHNSFIFLALDFDLYNFSFSMLKVIRFQPYLGLFSSKNEASYRSVDTNECTKYNSLFEFHVEIYNGSKRREQK